MGTEGDGDFEGEGAYVFYSNVISGVGEGLWKIALRNKIKKKLVPRFC